MWRHVETHTDVFIAVERNRDRGGVLVHAPVSLLQRNNGLTHVQDRQVTGIWPNKGLWAVDIEVWDWLPAPSYSDGAFKLRFTNMRRCHVHIPDKDIAVEHNRTQLDSLWSHILAALLIAEQKHPALNNTHEAYAVIRKEVEEMQHEIKQAQQDTDTIASTAIQIAALCVRMLRDLRIRPVVK